MLGSFPLQFRQSVRDYTFVFWCDLVWRGFPWGAEPGMDRAMLLILWHSRTGTAEAMARAAFAGALGEGQETDRARLLAAEQAMPADLLAADGYLFVCPENLGALSGSMKEMFDRCYYPLLGAIEGRPYATAIAAGTDGEGARRQLDRIVTGWRLRRVAEGVIVRTGAQTAAEILAPKHIREQTRMECHQLGQLLAEGISAGIF